MEECIVLKNEMNRDVNRRIRKYILKFIIEEIGYKGVNKINKNYEIL
jgi:hypothetical protein